MSRNGKEGPATKKTPLGSSKRQRKARTHVGGEVRFTGNDELSTTFTLATDISSEDLNRPYTHAFHAWPGRMHVQTAKALLAACEPQGSVLDPFMGGGTVLVEAMLAGRTCVGRDVNPVALEVAWARTRLWDQDRLQALQEASQDVIAKAAELREDSRVPTEIFESEKQWYDAPALTEIWSIANVIGESGASPVTRMLDACLSSIMLKASRQVSDSVPLLDREHRWIPKGRVESWFKARVVEQCAQLAELSKAVPKGCLEPNLRLQDARKPEPEHGGSIAGVVTSPPNPGVYDYVTQQRRRIVAFGLDAGLAEDAEIGSRREQLKRGWMSASWRFEEGLATALNVWKPQLMSNARVWFVVGDGQHDDGLIVVLPLIERAAGKAGYEIIARASQTRPVFGRASQHVSEREEHIIALEPKA